MERRFNKIVAVLCCIPVGKSNAKELEEIMKETVGVTRMEAEEVIDGLKKKGVPILHEAKRYYLPTRIYEAVHYVDGLEETINRHREYVDRIRDNILSEIYGEEKAKTIKRDQDPDRKAASEVIGDALWRAEDAEDYVYARLEAIPKGKPNAIHIDDLREAWKVSSRAELLFIIQDIRLSGTLEICITEEGDRVYFPKDKEELEEYYIRSYMKMLRIGIETDGIGEWLDNWETSGRAEYESCITNDRPKACPPDDAEEVPIS